MQVFISWSGAASKEVAAALRYWLGKVLQRVHPWMSGADIQKGARWSAEIARQLEECSVGIVCLTPNNLASPWLMFEAGALSKTVEQTYLCPYLFGLEPTDVSGPLAQFQLTRANRADTRDLVFTINKALEAEAMEEGQMEETFEVWWPRLEKRLERITLTERHEVQREERESHEETLIAVRFYEIWGLSPHRRGLEFQKIFAELVEQDGWSQEEGVRTPSEEIDVFVSRDGKYYIAECKWTARPVGASVIRELYGKLKNRADASGIVVSMSGFTATAADQVRSYASDRRILLFGPGEISALMYGRAAFTDLFYRKVDALVKRREVVYR